MSKYWSESVHKLTPYVPGEQPKLGRLIKLNTNENPYPPSPRVAEVLSRDSLDLLRLYPDPNSVALKRAVADVCQLTQANVFVGNGSDEVLALAFMAFFNNDKPVLFPDISYGFYSAYSKLFEFEALELPLAADFTINLADYQRDNGGIVFANPNAPTGIAKPLDEIERLLQKNTESVVIVDEAYIDFGGESAVPLVDQYPNLLVVQSLSKSRSLAGLRVGFALGSRELIDGLQRVKNSFNAYPINRISETAAVAALGDKRYFRECTKKIIATRAWTAGQLRSLGFEMLPSSANFIFARPTGMPAEEVAHRLRQKYILVRHFKQPRIEQFLRISIGSRSDMQSLVAALQDILPQ